MKTRRWMHSAALYSSLLIIGLAVWGCMSVRLIADYDQKIDEGVTALQRKTEAFLIKLERTCQTPEGAYAQHVSFYDEAKVDLSALQVRADAIALNKLTSEQLKGLRDSFEKIEAQHKQGLTSILVAETRKILNSHFTAILTLEVGKKEKLPSKN
jgi:low affinity Fe/Cu permease